MSTQSVNLDDAKITAIATSCESVVDSYIQNFLSNRKNVRKVIGLDVELTMIEDSEETEDWPRGKNSKRTANDEETKEESKMKSRVAILQLCDGDECLIVQLSLLDSMPKSLLNFLQLPDFSFVGVGIKDSIAKLERDYGLGCKNAVGLGQLAASVMEMPHLAACGLELLGHEVAPMKLDKPTSVVFSDWGKLTLNKKQIKFAATNCFAYFKIGNKLLGG